MTPRKGIAEERKRNPRCIVLSRTETILSFCRHRASNRILARVEEIGLTFFFSRTLTRFLKINEQTRAIIWILMALRILLKTLDMILQCEKILKYY